MELTLESAFSPGGMVGHLAYFLLVVSMMMQRISLLRLLVIASASVSIVYDWVWLREPVGVFWEALLVTVNVVQLLILHWKNIRATFDDHELDFVGGKFPGLSPSHWRSLLDAGEWVRLPDNTAITLEGEPAPCLVFIANGVVEIHAEGKHVSQCRNGDFIGEITVLNNDPATATTITAGEVHLWRIDRDALKRIVKRYPEISRELEASFARNYRDKLIQSNKLVAQGIVP